MISFHGYHCAMTLPFRGWDFSRKVSLPIHFLPSWVAAADDHHLVDDAMIVQRCVVGLIVLFHRAFLMVQPDQGSFYWCHGCADGDVRDREKKMRDSWKRDFWSKKMVGSWQRDFWPHSVSASARRGYDATSASSSRPYWNCQSDDRVLLALGALTLRSCAALI